MNQHVSEEQFHGATFPHPFAFLCWLVAVLATLSVTRNPLYLVLALLCIAIVGAATQPQDSTVSRPQPLRFAAILILFSTLFNGLTVHYGDTVLFLLPNWLPVVGGAITAEALLYGVLNGLVLTGFFAAFTVFTTALPTHALVDLLPPAFYPVAVVISIAISFVPTTLYQIKQIREAQAVRGHRLRGWRDWLPLWMPLLIGGLERALQLAEAMVARGFASSDTPRQVTSDQALLVGGLVALLVGWLLRLGWGIEVVGLIVMLCGVALISVALWRAGRRVPRTHYRVHTWRAADTLVVVASAVVLAVVVLPVPIIVRDSLFFYPYPQVQLPDFSAMIGIMLLGLLAPAVGLLRAP